MVKKKIHPKGALGVLPKEPLNCIFKNDIGESVLSIP